MRNFEHGRRTHRHVVSDQAAEDVPRKRAWLAVALTIVVPGLGHAYLRLWGRGLLWFLLVVGSVATLVPEWFSATTFDELVSVVEGVSTPISLALFGIAVLCVVDTYLMTSRLNERARREHGEASVTTCPECGRELDGDLDFCHWCTTELDDASTEE